VTVVVGFGRLALAPTRLVRILVVPLVPRGLVAIHIAPVVAFWLVALSLVARGVVAITFIAVRLAGNSMLG
jgi:hypothetical protein